MSGERLVRLSEVRMEGVGKRYGDTVALQDLVDDGKVRTFIEKAAASKAPMT